MTRDGRGSTHRGKTAPMPDRQYTPAPEATGAPVGTVVEFFGEDGRSQRFDLATVPLPGWHEAVAAALARRLGPSGTRRTRASAETAWHTTGSFLRVLAQHPSPPDSPEMLTVEHMAFVERIFASRMSRAVWVQRALAEVRRLLALEPLRGLIAEDALSFTWRRTTNNHVHTLSSYSDGEFRRLVQTARRDTAAIRDRMRVRFPRFAGDLIVRIQPGRLGS